MARKIFVSYKHRDSGVQPMTRLAVSTARDYVDRLEQLFAGDHIYKGERGDEDLGAFKDDTIQSHLRDRIFDSSITLVLISKNMKELGVAEEDQWIPWEVSYSLREKVRDGRVSLPNAMLAVALPDESGGYEFFVEQSPCSQCNTITWKTSTLFTTISRNMFNRKVAKQATCPNFCGNVFHTGNDHSYIYPVRWDQFIGDIGGYINLAFQINGNIDDYELSKLISA